MRYCSLRPSQHALWKMSTDGTAEVKTKVQNWLGSEGAMLFLAVFLKCNSTFRQCNSSQLSTDRLRGGLQDCIFSVLVLRLPVAFSLSQDCQLPLVS